MSKKNLSRWIVGALAFGAGFAAVPLTPAYAAEEGAVESAAAGVPTSYTLDAIVVTAGRSDTQIVDVPADVTLITQAEIERGNYKTVSDALKGSNINVVQKGFAAYPVINGDSRVLVMVDGKKVNWDHLVVSGDTNAVNVDQVAIDDVERIEIVRGPNSSLYGERAVSGVINIITKRPRTGDFKGNVNVQYGTWNAWRMGVTASGGDKENRFKIGYAKERRGNYDYKNTYGDKREFQNSDMRHENITLGYDRILGKDRLRLEFSRYDMNDGYGVLLSNPKTGASMYQGRTKGTDTGYGVTYMFKSESEGEGTFLRYYRNESKTDGGFNSQYSHNLSRDTVEGQKIWQISNANMLVGGFLWAREKIHEVSGYVPMDASATTKSLFFEDDWDLGNGYSLKFGSRYEHHDDFGGDLASHISINKKIGRNTHIYASWGQAINNPSLKMRYANTPFWKGNPNLEQETSQTYTLGAESQLSKKWRVSGSLYWSNVKNALNWTQGPLYGYYENVQTEDRRGMEFNATYHPSKEWQLRAAYSYAYIDSTDPAKGYLSKNTRPNGYRFGVSYTKGRWSADADMNYVTGRSKERFTDSSYFTLDLGVNYQVNDALKLYLKGSNLTDESYESIGATGSIWQPLGAYAMPGRHFTLGMTYNF